MATPLCMTRIFNLLCNTIIRHILIPFFFPLCLKDLSFIIYSGQLIYCTEFAKHSALQYRLFMSLHKMFFVFFCSCAQAVSSSPLTWIITTLPQPGSRSTIGNYFMAIQCTGSVNGAATAMARSSNPSMFKDGVTRPPPVYALMLEKMSV